jgi:tetratricopeptide (TPR) repeat protein
VSFSVISFAQESGSKLERGIWDYKHENYEEALELLKAAREDDANSSLAAYYLGITYKKLQDYKNARPHLEAAVTMTPKIKGALIELIDLLYRLDELDEAKKWVMVAEGEGIRPAQTAFLKGLTLLKEGRDIDDAIASLKNARELDDSLSQVVKYQIGIAHLKSKKLKEAKRIFNEIEKADPTTDLALFSRGYVRVIDKRFEDARPLRLTFGTFYQYDDNVTLRPLGEVLATDITDDRDNRIVYAGSAELNLRYLDYLGAKLGYAFYYGDQLSLDSFDVFSQIFAAQPGIYFEDVAITFPITLSCLRVDDRDYLNVFNIGNLTSAMINPEHMLQWGFGYKKKDFKWPVVTFDESRDGDEYLGHLAHYYFYTKDKKGFVVVKHEINFDDTKGSNWEYFGNQTTVTSVIPLDDKLKLTVAGKFFLQDFRNENSIFNDERLDMVFQVSGLLTYEILKGAEIQIQYTRVNNASNIAIYDYERNVYSAGVQFKF